MSNIEIETEILLQENIIALKDLDVGQHFTLPKNHLLYSDVVFRKTNQTSSEDSIVCMKIKDGFLSNFSEKTHIIPLKLVEICQNFVRI